MIVGALLARNEAGPDRWLERCIVAAQALVDVVVVVDDGSTDDTAAVCQDLGCIVERRDGDGFWGDDEAGARAQLWDLACRHADGGWIFFFDADMELLGARRDDLQMLAQAEQVTAWAWPLYDCWDDETLHRVDSYWVGWTTPRVWLVKTPPEGFTAAWHRHGLHVGHAPANLPLLAAPAPPGIAWRHLSYLTAEHREVKAEQYLACA